MKMAGSIKKLTMWGKCEDAVSIIRAYEGIKTIKKNINCVAYRQDLIFKRFKWKIAGIRTSVMIL